MGITCETLPVEICQWYQQYAADTWNSIDAMVYPNGLITDHLHYLRDANGLPTEVTQKIDKTSPTNIGFKLAADAAASNLRLITPDQARHCVETTLSTLHQMITDPKVFVPTGVDKGLFVNWVKPSNGEVLLHWPNTGLPVEQQLSSVDNAWLAVSLKLVRTQFPEIAPDIDEILDRIDLPFMFDDTTGCFYVSYTLDGSGFKKCQYDAFSEARIIYAACPDTITQRMPSMFARRSGRYTFTDSNGHRGVASWNSAYFEYGWPLFFVPEPTLSEQWEKTHTAAFQAQADCGDNNGKHLGFSSTLAPNGEYTVCRVPSSAQCPDDYQFQPIITPSALVNMAMIDPVRVAHELQQLHDEFPCLRHSFHGDGDSVNILTGQIQPDQLSSGQIPTFLSLCNILSQGCLQNLFMQSAPPSLRGVYAQPLW